VSVGLRSDGKEFHSFGTQAAKLWYNLNLDMGVTRVALFRAKMTQKLFRLNKVYSPLMQKEQMLKEQKQAQA